MYIWEAGARGAAPHPPPPTSKMKQIWAKMANFPPHLTPEGENPHPPRPHRRGRTHVPVSIRLFRVRFGFTFHEKL